MAKFEKGHAKVGGKKKGTANKLTDRARTAALDMLQRFDEAGTIKEDIEALEPVERVNAYIRLLSIVTPKNIDMSLAAQAAITIEEQLAALAEENEQQP